MTKGELIVACIKLMYDNYDNELDPTIISNIDEYKERTVNIIESINRALIVIDDFGKIPSKIFRINNKTELSELSTSNWFRYDLEKLIEDYSTFLELSVEEQNGYYHSNTEYRFEGSNVLVVRPFKDKKTYLLKYKPIVYSLTYDHDDDVEIPYSNKILSHIPYFVKADLIEEDDVQKSVLARNIFEQYVINLPDGDNEGRQSEIRDHYGFW